MDNQKDFYIKEKLQKDKLISKKADDVFNNFFKGDFSMKEEINSENSNDKKVDTNEEMNTKEQNNTKAIKNKGYKKLVATAASVLVLFGAANVYAMTQGYENIFFMIKYLTTGEQITITDKNEILSDRDITISFEPIKITNKIKLQVKNLQIKDSRAKLFLVVNEETLEDDTDIVPLTYKVYNLNDELLCTYESVKKDYIGQSLYTEELVLQNFKESDELLKLEIHRADSKLITTLKIDLESKTIEVAGEEEALEKVSEIELKEFLGFPSLLYDAFYDGEVNDEGKIWLAIITANNLNYELERFEFKNLKNNYGGVSYGYKVDDINLILEKMYGIKLENLENFENAVDGKSNEFKLYEKNGEKYFVNSYNGGIISPVECIDITNISYCAGVYTVTYTYCELPLESTVFDVDINEYDIFEQTITFKLNDDFDENLISKFQLISWNKPIIVKSAESKEEGTVVDSPNNTEKENENKILNTNVYSSEDVETIKIYFKGKWIEENKNEVIIVKEDMTFEIQKNGKTEKGIIQKVDAGGNESVPTITFKYTDGKIFTYKLIQGSESYLVSDDLLSTYTYTPDIEEDDTVSDIVDNTEELIDTTKVDNYASTMSWTEYWTPGLKLKYPTIFELEEIGGYNRGNRMGEISTTITGIATGINPDTKEIVKSNMIIDVYEPLPIDNFNADDFKLSTKTRTTTGLEWYSSTVYDENGGAVHTYKNYLILDDGNVFERKIVITTDVYENYKVLNITNWLLNSTELGSY